ncbi:MAG: hypothetical protein HWE25_10690 [Alphaproteobacteria bacterium]|nr:hypothetical protein [Alphaproteobacteria bacterium]
MTIQIQIPEQKVAGTSSLDGGIGKLLFLFQQLQPWQVEDIVFKVRRALPIQVKPENEEDRDAPFSRSDAAQKAVVQLLYMIAPQTYPDILFALTYAEALAMMQGAELDEFAVAH